MPSITATSVAVASLAMAAIGTGVSIYGQIQAGDAAKKQADYQAAVGRNNAILAQRAADDARQRGDVAAQQRAVQGRQLIARQRATLANNGVDVNSGSALDITTDTAGLNKLDELTIRSNAEREALGFEAQGSNFNANAALAELSGANAQSAATTSAIGTGFSGFGTVASKWYDFNQKGAFSGGSSIPYNTSPTYPSRTNDAFGGP